MLRNSRFVQVTAFFIAYVVLAGFSLTLTAQPSNALALWPVGGFVVTVLIVSDRPQRIAFLAASLPANLLANLLRGSTFSVSLAFACANTLDVWIISSLLLRFLPDLEYLRKIETSLKFASLTAGGAAIGALAGASIGAIFFGLNYIAAWLNWWLGDCLSILVITPPLLYWYMRRSKPLALRWQRWLEFGLLITLVVAGIYLIFYTPGGITTAFSLERTYLFFPLLIWLIIRFEIRLPLAALLLISLGAADGTAAGLGQFAETGLPVELALINAQIFIFILSLSAYILMALTETRNRDERELRVSEERFHLIYETAEEGILITAPDGAIFSANPAAARMLGWSEAELVQAGRNLILDASDPALPVALAERQRTGRVSAELTMIRKDGSHFLGDISSVMFRNSDGEQRTSVIIRDVTEQRRLAWELKNERDFLNSLINDIGQGIVLTNLDLVIELANQALANMMGRSVDEVAGKPILEFIHPDDIHLLYETREARLEGGVTVYEVRLIHKDGHPVEALVTSVLRYKDDQIVGGLAGITDLTELRQAERLRQESEQRFNQAFRASPIGVVIASRKLHRALDVNDAACAITGYFRAELLQEDFHFPEKLFPAIRFEQIKAVFRGQGSLKDFETPIQTRSGEIRHIVVSLGLFGAPESEQFLLLMVDITARKLAEDALQAAHDELEQRVQERTAALQIANLNLERASRAKDEFLATVSHELRTPLVGIIGLAEALQMPFYGELSARQLKAIQNILASGRKLNEIVAEVLEYTRLQSEALKLTRSKFSLNDLCLECLDEITGPALKKDLAVTQRFPAADIQITTDRSRLKQVIFHLLSNAVKFTPEFGRVSLVIEQTENPAEAVIRIEDSGIGIAEEDFEKIFKPFVQLDARLARNYEGIGMGLPIVKALLGQLQGRLEIESVPGQGSTFSIFLPIGD